MRTFDDIIESIKNIKGIHTDIEVASLLGMKRKTFASAKFRKSIPHDILIDFCNKENISLDWLLTGEGEAKKSSPPISLTMSEEQRQFFVNVNQYVADHNKQIIENMLGRVSRIINEGDIRKTSALQSFLEVLDPKQEGKE